MLSRPATRAELRQLASFARARDRRGAGECLVEGATLLGEALDAGLRPRVVAVSEQLAAEQQELLERAAAAGAEVLLAEAESLARAADRERGPALLAAVDMAEAGNLSDLPTSGAALVAVLCGLQDPGNVGTLLRSARAFGAALCVCLPGTADVWGPKVIRSSAGAVFSLPVLALPSLDELLGASDLTPAAALPPVARGVQGGAAESPGSLLPQLPDRCLLLLGHETRGIQAAGAVSSVTVPQMPGVDSLNVAMAGSILMADWYRARAQ
ncbi:MAG: TrmH family RNA methyltransferase [Pseudohongiellaceae bacterium]|jgi:TrmH family RNA methyltransferase